MEGQTIAVRAVLMMAMITAGVSVEAGEGVYAQTPTMDKYMAAPPFVQDQVKPNILIIMDNSGSMECRAYDGTDCSGAAFSFTAATKYTGYFDEKTCYTYNGPDTRFVAAATKAAYGDTCSGGDKYDGNLLNYITFRRFDAVKKAMIGGDCYTPSGATRDADGLCLPYGATTSKKTIKSQTKFSGSGTHHITPGLPRTDASCSTTSNTSYCGRIPDADAKGGNATFPNNIYFHLRGGTSGAQGSFCVANSSSALSNTNTDCNVAGGFSESKLWVRVALDVEPQGVIQRVGAQARFGLAVFNGDSSNNGIKVLTGVGLRQSIDLTGTTIETFNTNTAAMVDSIEESSPLTWTPLAESLYEAARYYAQINSSFYTSSYAYPIAFSGTGSAGVNLAATGAGSIGNNPSPGELKVLIGSETCPAGYITDACGRDPYFMGADQNFAWTKASIAAACCRSFVILLTDGTPTQDTTISPTALKTYAQDNALPALDGTTCTGNRGVPYLDPPGSTCNNDPATPNKVLLKQHRTDYGTGSHYLDDIAFWMHTNDMRPCGGGTAEVGDATIAGLATTGHCLKGLQNVTLYTMYAFGNISGRELLMHAAMMGGFDDTNNNKKPDVQSEWDKVNNLTGTTGSTVAGCNADCIPDTYFESSNVDDLEDRLLGALASILSRSASGTSISVLATSSTGEGSIYQAYFYTNESGQNGSPVKWKGYTQSLFIDQYGNFREDRGHGTATPDGRLVYEDDPIVTSEYYNNVDDVNDPNNRKVVVKRYADISPADGQADTPTTPIDPTVLQLKDIQPVWEAGRNLAELDAGTTTCTNANAGETCRRILTWVDKDNDGFVDSDERQEFITTNTDINNYVTKNGTSAFTATQIINFIRGCEPTVCTEQQSLRYRQSQTYSGSGVYRTWKYGDPIHSTPTVVAAPRERYDLIYGDAGYRAYYQMWRPRREMVYVGANDGMLHAFNGGYYHRGDDSSTAYVEHGWYTKNPTNNTSGKKLGAEMWAFVPFQLLPQLEWLVREDYSHVYYVDLKPKVTDAAIFCEGGGVGIPAGPAAGKCIAGQTGVVHPGGWGTILIGGFRMGGSCANCPSGSAPEMSFTVGGTNRKFYSAYFVLDVTDPEKDPVLLWSFTDANLGLTTSYPAVVRVNPTTSGKTSNADAQWFALFGSGPNGYDASMPSTPVQTSKMYAVRMDHGPRSNGDTTNDSTYVTAFDAYDTNPAPPPPNIKQNSFLGHIITMDRDLDFRVDVAYAGRTINDGTAIWAGKLERLTTGGCTTSACSPATWGINVTGATRSPSEITNTFAGTTKVGPITGAPTVTTDDANNVWVFYGTGRYLSNSDKVDTNTQYLFGVKDRAMSGCDETVSRVNCVSDQLVNVTGSVLCLVCASGTNQVSDPNNTAVTKFDDGTATSMVGLVASKHGWYIAMPAGERSVSSPTLIGGTVFFPSFKPTSDVCASTGTSYLYALFYKTGTAFTSPIIGTAAPASGTTNILNKITLGDGLASQMSMQIGRAGSGNVGTGISSISANDANNTAGSTTGCAGGVTGAIQMGGGNVAKPCVRPSGSAWSQYVSWMNERS